MLVPAMASRVEFCSSTRDDVCAQLKLNEQDDCRNDEQRPSPPNDGIATEGNRTVDQENDTAI